MKKLFFPEFYISPIGQEGQHESFGLGHQSPEAALQQALDHREKFPKGEVVGRLFRRPTGMVLEKYCPENHSFDEWMTV